MLINSLHQKPFARLLLLMFSGFTAFFPCRFNMSNDQAYDDMFQSTPTALRDELLADIFKVHDLRSTKLKDVWPFFEEMLGKETIFEPIKEGWTDGIATLCQKEAGEVGNPEAQRQ